MSARARTALAKSDPKMATLIERVGEIDLATRLKRRSEERPGDAYGALLRAIVGQQLSTKAARTIYLRVIDLFDNGQGQFMARGTRFAAWNAVTEYADHTRTTRRGASGDDAETSRLSSAWFGSGADLKDRALKLLLA